MENYLGAKTGSGVYQAIINLIPPHDTYIEPFLGTGAILKRKAPSFRNIGVDLNQKCIDAFNYTAERSNENIIDKNDCTAVELHCDNAFTFLESFDFTRSGKTVIYCDPPYLHSTRTSNARYEHEMNDDEHRRLLSLLNSLNCHVILSGYRNKIYDELIGNWWNIDFQAMSRGGVRTETIWCNFEPKDVHYHTYAGTDFTDRQRIKRKAERWAKNFEAMPAQERQAVLTALLQVT